MSWLHDPAQVKPFRLVGLMHNQFRMRTMLHMTLCPHSKWVDTFDHFQHDPLPHPTPTLKQLESPIFCYCQKVMKSASPFWLGSSFRTAEHYVHRV